MNIFYQKQNQIYYSPTHDNETLNESLINQGAEKRKQLSKRMKELGINGNGLYDKLIKYCLRRKERIIVINVTDMLNLTKTHRINSPGTINNVNWTFKLKDFTQISSAIKYYFN